MNLVTHAGVSWKRRGKNKLDGYIYGRVAKNSSFTGDKLAYIYSDFKTVLFGHFKDEVMMGAKFARIRAHG